ncbi:MAG: hypothetical protein ACFE0S_09340 [Rhodospirillales bacterium]
MATDITPIVLTAGLTTIGTFFITRYTHGLNLSRESQAREDEWKRRASYLAARVVCVLDPFVMACCDVVGDNGIYDPKGVRHIQVSTPTLELPQDVDWKSISPALMYRILALPNQIEAAEKAVSWVGSELAFPPDYDEAYDERCYQYARLGLTAFDLAAELREMFGLPDQDYGKWNPRSYLEGSSKEEFERRETAGVALSVAQSIKDQSA